MELIDLKAVTRQGKGKCPAREMRRNNSVPAILYGATTEPLMISVKNQDLEKVIRENGSTGVFLNLMVDGNSETAHTVLLKEVQMDVFNLKYLHIDLQEIDLDKKIQVSVPVEAVGESVGVKEGGLLQLIRRELDILCRPADMPDTAAIDISKLEIGDSVHVEDLDFGENIEIPHEVNFTILTIVPPTTSEDEDTVEEEEAEGEVTAAASAEEA